MGLSKAQCRQTFLWAAPTRPSDEGIDAGQEIRDDLIRCQLVARLTRTLSQPKQRTSASSGRAYATVLLHQPLHALLTHADALRPQLPPDARPASAASEFESDRSPSDPVRQRK